MWLAGWEWEGVGGAWVGHMHGFGWLRDLRALGGDASRKQARDMIASWISRYRNWNAAAWAPGLTGRRVANWIALYDFYGASAGHEFQQHLLSSLIRQARHLSRSLPATAEGLEKFYDIRGLAFAGLAFSGRQHWLEQALDLLQQETPRQILPDGGHISRSPQILCDALKIFVDIRAALLAAGFPVPEQLTHTIDRMAQALRFFRYPDRGFALFNGAQEGDAALIDAVLTRANGRGKILSALPFSNYQRIAQGRSILMAANDSLGWTVPLTPWGLQGTRTARLEISSTGLIGLNDRVQDLITYPHGCLEQTLSGLVPQIFLRTLVPWSPEAQLKTADANVRA